MPSKKEINAELLHKRGFLPLGAENQVNSADTKQLLELLGSAIPTERTLAARLMAIKQDDAFIEPLIAALIIEQKLYSKLAICKALEFYETKAILPLAQQLGKIGANQHLTISDKAFRKDSYPLPRDIAARILVRIGVVALPTLFKIIKNGDIQQISEAIDAIGFIHFYENKPACFEQILACYEAHKTDELIRWKCIRAMSGCPEAETILLELQKTESHPIIKFEIDRSLRLAGR